MALRLLRVAAGELGRFVRRPSSRRRDAMLRLRAARRARIASACARRLRASAWYRS